MDPDDFADEAPRTDMERPDYPPRVIERPAHVTETIPVGIRGGFAPWSVLTGIVTAIGAMLLMGAIVGAILTRNGAMASDIRFGTSTWSIIGAIAFFVAQFLAYMWGGYAAGRMARGSGFLNGLMVPLGTIILVAITGGTVALIGAHTNLTNWRSTHLAIGDGSQLSVGIGFGVLMLVMMFAGGIIGGLRGARWHDRIEDVAVEHPRARFVA